jgi:hypothetical protein
MSRDRPAVSATAWPSARLSFASEPLAHTAILFLALVAFLASLFSTFDMSMAFAIIDYMRPMDHAFKIEMMPRLITFDGLSVVFSIGAVLLVFIKRNRNILLNILPQYLVISERLCG